MKPTRFKLSSTRRQQGSAARAAELLGQKLELLGGARAKFAQHFVYECRKPSYNCSACLGLAELVVNLCAELRELGHHEEASWLQLSILADALELNPGRLG
jgi:hypothetical protein